MFKIFFYINDLNDIQKENLNQLKNINIIYRNYKRINYIKNAQRLSEFCYKKGFRLYVSNDEKLAKRIHSFGLYLPSFNINKSYVNSHFNIIGSAHNEIELRKKIHQGCKEIFVSPIFDTNTYRNKPGKGLHFFRQLIMKYSKKIKIHALGGINHQNINKIISSGGSGFSSISMVEKKMNNSLISHLNLIATNL